MAPLPASPIDSSDLATAEGRERALDRLGEWFVDALSAANGDRAMATTVLTDAIRIFYDIRESAAQFRGEYAGHFFFVDAIGLGDSDRPVPWDALHRRVSAEHLELYRELFDELERTVA